MAPTPPAILAVEHLCKTYGELTAVDDISFRVAPGEIVGLVGPNGAGKTTTLNMILGVLEPTAGRIEIEGIDLRRQRTSALSRTNFERIEQLLTEYDLVRFRRTKAGLLSSGEQTRLGLAKAMLNRPRLLLLDEPTASIDPSSARDIRALIAAVVDSGHSGVLWTSHNMYEVEAVCDRVLFLSRGKILLEGDPKALPHQHGAASLDDLFVAVAHEALHGGAVA
jgi:ABC-2 type transport system ATP-binding protein